jgi:hypothetical protein
VHQTQGDVQPAALAARQRLDRPGAELGQIERPADGGRPAPRLGGAQPYRRACSTSSSSTSAAGLVLPPWAT